MKYLIEEIERLREEKHKKKFTGEKVYFAEYLKIKLDELGIRQSDFAARAGCSNQSIYNYLKGRADPLLSAVVKMSEIINIEFDKIKVD